MQSDGVQSSNDSTLPSEAHPDDTADTSAAYLTATSPAQLQVRKGDSQLVLYLFFQIIQRGDCGVEARRAHNLTEEASSTEKQHKTSSIVLVSVLCL